ncbi:MAG TPA: CAAX prenyl protease-related protein [Syntrophobacteraceae bacterium]|nr:CAAX prenyl protease-related protein [Syntrophobacteraceae bacterium]
MARGLFFSVFRHPTSDLPYNPSVLSRAVPRVLPFAVFMAFVGVDEIAGFLSRHGIIDPGEYFPFVVYPLKALAAAAVLLSFRSVYSEIKFGDLSRLRDSTISVFAGLALFVAWINLDYSIGPAGKGFNPTLIASGFAMWLVIAIRLTGAALIVPIMEELFWRSFLIRCIIRKEFDEIPIGTFTWSSFILCSIFFGLEHQLIIAGIAAGIVYNLILYSTKSISQCILCHAVTNLALGIYVLSTGQYRFW